jgi:hypothetical protein
MLRGSYDTRGCGQAAAALASAGPSSAMAASGKQPSERISAVRRGWAIANGSASAAGAGCGHASSAAMGAGCGGGGSAIGAGAVRPSASAIRPMVQCSSQAALSSEALSASRFWRTACTRISNDRAPRACRIMQADWAMHCRGARGIRRVLPRLPQAVHRLGTGGDILCGDVGLVGIGGKQARDLGDGGIVAAGAVLGRGADRRRERAAQGVDDLVVHVAGELEGEVGLGG